MATNILGQAFEPATPPTSDEKTMALLSHLLVLVASFVAPLVIYLLKKDESSFVANNAKESLNFQITIAIAIGVSVLLMMVLIGFLLIFAVSLANLVYVIIATMRASEGKSISILSAFDLSNKHSLLESFFTMADLLRSTQ